MAVSFILNNLSSTLVIQGHSFSTNSPYSVPSDQIQAFATDPILAQEFFNGRFTVNNGTATYVGRDAMAYTQYVINQNSGGTSTSTNQYKLIQVGESKSLSDNEIAFTTINLTIDGDYDIAGDLIEV